MVDALNKNLHNESGEEVLDQLLHGYSDGHRLLQGSRRIPDELSRQILRMSDLSGGSVVDGFDEYFTGYPLTSLELYALAKTWYAPEMPRPGCVWTHTLLIPVSAMSRLRFLGAIESFFRRPGQTGKSDYSKPLHVTPALNAEADNRALPKETISVADVLFHFYQNADRPLVLPAQSSRKFESTIFALWSQQWPELRMRLTFCTGSLSARNYGGRPLDIQCIPISRTREVSLAISAESAVQPDILESISTDIPVWAVTAGRDASAHGMSEVRKFLWSVSGASANRSDFVSFMAIFDSMRESPALVDLIALIATLFPEASSGVELKNRLLGGPQRDFQVSFSERDVLLELAKTSHFASFDGAKLLVEARSLHLCAAAPESATWLLTHLFQASLNPLGEEILNGLMSGVNPEMAISLTNEHPELLPSLFRAKPDLAVSARLWRQGGERKRELFESVASHDGLNPSLIASVVSAMLDSGADGLIGRALDRWGKDAVYQVLAWSESRNGEMSDMCRQALSLHVNSVMDWVTSHPDIQPESAVAIARVVAPYSHDVVRYDSTIWLRTFRSLRGRSNETTKNYIGAFIVALGLRDAPPSPIELLSVSFEEIHEAASRKLLTDEAWLILEPLVPELAWYSNWDKCERLRRALVSAFVQYRWADTELRKAVKDREMRCQIVKSAKKVEGGQEYFRHLHVSD
jgi:hypothetical protein